MHVIPMSATLCVGSTLVLLVGLSIFGFVMGHRAKGSHR